MALEFFPFVMGRVATHPIELIDRLAMREAAAALDESFAAEEALAAARAAAVDALHALIPSLSDPRARSKALDIKRRVFKGALAELSDEQLAALHPALSPEGERALADLAASARAAARAGEAARSLFEAGLAKARAELAAALSDPFVREAVYLSHQGMWESLLRYLERGDDRKFERHISSHIARACTKTVPRGLLTAVRLGELDPASPEPVAFRRDGDGRGVFRRRTMVSLVTMRRIAAELSWQTPAFRHVVPRVNPTLREDPAEPGKLLYWRAGAGEETLCRLPKNELIAAFLAEARPRTRTAAELLAAVGARFEELSGEQAESFYRQLCEKGLLVGTLEIPFSEIDGLAHVLGWLESLPADSRPEAALRDLREVREQLAALDAGAGEPEAVRLGRYARAMELLDRHYSHPAEQPLQAFQAFVVDGLSPWRPVLGAPALARLRELWEQLVSLQADRAPRVSVKDNLYYSLRACCGGRDDASILELVDPAAPGREERSAGSPRKIPAPAPVAPSVFRELAGQAPRPSFDGRPALALPPAAKTQPEQPGEGYFTLQFARGGAGAWHAVMHQSSPGLASGFLRWHHLFEGTGFVDALKRLVIDAPAPTAAGEKAVKAAPLYHHGTHTDTASCLPSLYPYEIELNGPPSRYPVERIIPIGQLRLAVSHSSREIGLVWAAEGGRRPVMPLYDGLLSAGVDPAMKALRMFSMFSRSGSVLGVNPRWAMQGDGEAEPRPPLHAPRLELAGVSACREIWALPVDELREAPSDLWGRWVGFRRFRRARGLPRRVFVRGWEARESPLYLDFENPFLIDALAAELERDAQPREFQEMLPAPESFLLRGEGGRYAHELVVGWTWR